MKANLTKFCAVILLAAQTVVLAQKTEVSVQKGKVKATTKTGSVVVNAGHMGILKKDKNPIVALNNPLVNDVLKLHELVEEEKKYSDLQIDSATVFAVNLLEEEQKGIVAAYLEFPNALSFPTNVFKLGPMILMEQAEVYDLNGNLLQVSTERIDDTWGLLNIHFREEVETGGLFKFVVVAEQKTIPVLPGESTLIWKEGPLWHFAIWNNIPNCLNYFRYILPASAIFVESDQQVISMDIVDGRVAVTMRNYTGPTSDGLCVASFLWPVRDGTTLADIPDKYHWLRTRIVDEVDIIRQESGQKSEHEHNMQGHNTEKSLYRNKVCRLATDGWFSYDMKVLPYQALKLICTYWGDEGTKKLFDIQVDDVKIATQELLHNKPEEFFDVEYELPIELTREKEKVTIKFKAHPGSTAGGVYGCKIIKALDKTTEPIPVSDLSMVTYKGLKPGEFMTRWAILGPMTISGVAYPPEEEAQKKAFESEPLDLKRFESKVTLDDEEYQWKYLLSRNGTVTPPRPSDRLYYVTGYAWAQIDMPEETDAVLGIGSDDGVKVWLNGKLVHENWVFRGVSPDNDRVPVTFKKGNNQLVLKILNGSGGWGFACRVLEAKSAY